MRSIILDNEAVQALAEVGHPKHRAVVAHLAGAAARRRRGRVVEVMVPTAVRVEAAWARTRPSAAAINRYRVRDHPLDTASADVAAELQRASATGVADAHLGATVHSCSPGEVVVLTSDPDDVAVVCSPTPATIVAI